MTCQTREEFVKALGVTQMPELFGVEFEKTMRIYDEQGVWFLQDGFVAQLQEEFGIFRVKYDFVKKALKRVRENELLARYALLLYEMQKAAHVELKEIKLKEYPHGAPESHADYEMAALFSQLAFAPDIAAYHRAHGVPEDVIEDTLNDCFECGILVCNDCFDRDGCHPRCFGWNQLYINYKILRIGVLNFEMRNRFTSAATVFGSRKGEYVVLANGQEIAPNGQMAESVGCTGVAYHADIIETDAYYEGHAADPVFAVYGEEPVRLDKNEWSVVLSENDPILNVHIPSSVSITPENTEIAYRRAAEVVSASFPEFCPKAFACFSWLLDPQLRDMLKPTSNVLAFQSRYQLFARKCDGMAVHSFLFRKPVTRIEDWVEDTSLQRTVKAHYLAGGYIYEPGGVFFDYILKEQE